MTYDFNLSEQTETSRGLHQLLLAELQAGRGQKHGHQKQEVTGSRRSSGYQGLPDGEEIVLLAGYREDWHCEYPYYHKCRIYKDDRQSGYSYHHKGWIYREL